MSTRRSDNVLQTIAIVVMVFVWVWFFLGCTPVEPIGIDGMRVQQIEIQKAIIERQESTIRFMQETLDSQDRIRAIRDSSDRLCDSLVVKVSELARHVRPPLDPLMVKPHRVRIFDNPLDSLHGRSDAQSILSIP